RATNTACVQLPQAPAAGPRARAAGVEPLLLVPAAGHVVAEDPADALVGVVAGEERDDDQALHRAAQVGTDHPGEPVGLALERQHPALKLLVVLKLNLEQPDQVDADARYPGDADT